MILSLSSIHILSYLNVKYRTRRENSIKVVTNSFIIPPTGGNKFDPCCEWVLVGLGLAQAHDPDLLLQLRHPGPEAFDFLIK